MYSLNIQISNMDDDDVFNNINDYNPLIKQKKSIVFDETNKNVQAIIKDLIYRCRKLNISLVFITQSYFSVPKKVRLISTHYLIMKIKNNKESFKILLLIIQQILIIKIYKVVQANHIPF